MKNIFYLLVVICLSVLTVSLQAQYWEKVTSIPQPYDENYWLDAYFMPANTNYGWICGFNGMVIRTTDGGASWRGTVITGAYHLEHIHFPSASVGYCSGVEGIFRSTDGGASWRSITPNDSNGYWGCYFITENDGVVLSEGCSGRQRFWRTTDGGASWSLFETFEPNTGLTDAMILEQNGLGYASSSGKIWRTTDGGSTWAIFATTGTNIWQEEITNINSSFLIPTAGETCSGAGWSGGMRFSTDNGTSWQRYSARGPMFGTFLLGEREGWACGYFGQCFYTSNAGISWDMLNCGLDTTHLDDIWFNGRNSGWVVGEGVYKLAPAKHHFSKDSISFGEVCVPALKYDTLRLRNLNFDLAQCSLDLVGRDASSFLIQLINTNFSISACGTYAIPIQAYITSLGLKYALLRIRIDGSNVYEIPITAYGVKSTITPRDTLLIMNPAPCGKKTEGAIIWDAQMEYDERIVALQQVSGSKDIYSSTMIPAKIQTKFTVEPSDTGWISTRFILEMEPCARDTFITVKAYGVSPIINVEGQYSSHIDCIGEFIEKIPIFNGGNDTLIISSAIVTEGSAQFSVAGWASGSAFPALIPPGKSDTLFVRFKSGTTGGFTGKLRLENNDSTKARGAMNPREVRLAATYAAPLLSVAPIEIDFGEVCIGKTGNRNITIKNEGDLAVRIVSAEHKTAVYRIGRDYNTNPQSLSGGNSVEATIEFAPNRIGVVRDTILFFAEPCSDTLAVIVRGTAINSELIAEPASIRDFVQTFKKYEREVRVTALESEDLTITQITLTPDNHDWNWSYSPALPVMLKPGEYVDFKFEFYTEKDGLLKSKICFIAESKCPAEACVDIELLSQSRVVSVMPGEISFPFHKCAPIQLYETISVKNIGMVADTLVRIELLPDNTPFTLLDAPTLPFIIEVGDSLTLILGFLAPEEGDFSAELFIETIRPPGQSFVIPLSAEYKSPLTIPKYKALEYGFVEFCDKIRRDTITFQNFGKYPDTIEITRATNAAGFTTMPDKMFDIQPGNSVDIIVTMKPDDFQNVGYYKEAFTLKSKVCPTESVIDCNVDIIRPRLTIIPNAINYGNIWIESSKTEEIAIYNNSGYQKRVTGAALKPDIGVFRFDSNFPAELEYGDSLKLAVVFNADAVGLFECEIVIYEESICKDSTSINLKANVPREEYSSVLRIGRYEATPGEFVTIAAILETAVPRVVPDSIFYRIEFDKWLFNPIETYIRDTSGIYAVLPLNYSDGSISGAIPNRYSEQLLKESGEILLIKGLALASMPDSTALKIKEFEPVTNKDVSFEKEDGLLRITNFCKPVGAWKIRLMPTAYISQYSPAVKGDLLNLSLNSTGSQSLRIEISNLLGAKLLTADFSVVAGERSLEIDISSLPSGTYFIAIVSEFGKNWRDKFIKIE